MKKIVLGAVVLMTLCANFAQADLIEPEEAARISNLSREERLAECKELLKDRPKDVFSFDYQMIWEKQWIHLDCETVLDEMTGQEIGEQAGSQAANEEEARPSGGQKIDKPADEQESVAGLNEESSANSIANPTPAEKQNKVEFRAYGLIGLGVLLICAVAFGLLLKTRNKNLPRAL